MKSKSNSSLATNSHNQSFFKAVVGLINYDFCPRANPYIYCLKQPFGFVVLAILSSLLAGLFIGPQGFVLMWAFVSFMVIGTVWPWLSLWKVKCSLSFTEQRTQENCETIARLEVVNRWPFPIYGMMIEGKFLQDVLDPDDLIATGMQKIPGWSASEFTWQLKPQRRGCMPIETPELSTGFPFGILKSSKSISVSNQTIVWPKSIPMDGELNPIDSNHTNGNTLIDRPGYDGDTIGVRDFRQGDSMRHVHWAKTAQLNRLITRELQSSIQRTVRIVLDLSAETHLGTGSKSSYEMAIRAAGTISRQLQSKRISVNLQCTGLSGEQSATVSTDGGTEAFFDFLAMLPSLEELSAKDPKVEPINCLTQGKSRREPVIMICTPGSPIRDSVELVMQTFLVEEGKVVKADEVGKKFAVKQHNQTQVQFDDGPVQPIAVGQSASGWNTPNFASV